MSGRTACLCAAALAVVAGAAAGIVVLAAGGKSSGTPVQYLTRASAVCRVFARKLDRVPPPDLGSTKDVASRVGQALPILEQQAEAVRRIRVPRELEQRVRVFFQRTDRSLRALAAVLDAARRDDAKTMGPRLGVWLEASDAAQSASKQVGYTC